MSGIVTAASAPLAAPPGAAATTTPLAGSRAPQRGPQPQRRILVAIGRAAVDEAKLSVARDYARAFAAEVVLLHVSPADSPATGVVSFPVASARAYLDTLVAYFRAAGVRAELVVRAGAVAQAIVAEARRQQAELIVLGANTRPALLKAVTGSIADAVVGAAPCPVVLVRPAAEAGPPRPLHSFAAAAARAGAVRRRPARRQCVEVARIVGSVGRAAELEADFRPPRRARRGHDEQRLERVRAAMARQEALPPVELYQLGSGYYVLDGHHRVAAARQLGQLAIEANVVQFVPGGRDQ
jgi:nucleotide-binding universal stress UspA family protein